MERFTLLTSAQLVDKSNDLRAQSSLLLDTLLQRDEAEKKAQEDKIAQLEKENASLKQVIVDINSESQALELEASTKVDELKRQLHPRGSWVWIWDQEKEDALNHLQHEIGNNSRAPSRRSKRKTLKKGVEANDVEESDLDESQGDDRSGWEMNSTGWTRVSITDAQRDKLARKLQTVPQETRTVAKEIVQETRAPDWNDPAFSYNGTQLNLKSLPQKTAVELYELVVYNRKPRRYNPEGGVKVSSRDCGRTEPVSVRKGHWSWSLDGYEGPAPKAVQARTSPPASLETLPLELADMITSLLPDKTKSILGLVSFGLLATVSRTLYHSPKMSAREAISFANARLLYAAPDNRIRPLLLPSTLQLQRVNELPPFPSQLLIPPQGYMFTNGRNPSFEISSRRLIPLPRLEIVTDDVASPDNELRFWTNLLYLFNPSSFQLTVGSTASRILPPTINRLAPPSDYNRANLVRFSKQWNRLEEVVAVGPRSVLLLPGGSGNELVFGECLERSRVAMGRGPTLYHQLETKRARRAEGDSEEWISKQSIGTRLALPPPALKGDESLCRLVMKG